MGSASALHLSFRDHVHKLNAGQKDPGTAKIFEAQHGPGAPLDRPMALPDEVVEIFGQADFVRYFLENRPEQARRVRTALFSMVARGHLRPPATITFALANARDAVLATFDCGRRGKIVVLPGAAVGVSHAG